MIPETQAKIDGVVGLGAVTSPWWLPYAEAILSNAASLIMWAGGFILLALRIAIAYREWRQKK